jgi:quercetin dioxygenase-like cupin family protein
MIRMSHPDPKGPPDHTLIKPGEIWENPVNRERLTILERPWDNPEGRATFEMTALVGARVVGEHRHPAIVERFTVIEGELSVKRNRQTGILRQGETAVAEAGVWHDWWNAGQRDARVRVEIKPGERFLHMIETFFGLARLGTQTARACPVSCNSFRSHVSSATWSSSVHRQRACSALSLGRSRPSRGGAAIAGPTRNSHAVCWRPELSTRRFERLDVRCETSTIAM